MELANDHTLAQEKELEDLHAKWPSKVKNRAKKVRFWAKKKVSCSFGEITICKT